jgi:filamentous hemagglutinin family protein
MNIIKVSGLLLPPIVLSSVLGCVSIVAAQTYQPSNRVPIADNTLGTQVAGSGNNFTITGGVSRGQNLFQSFQDFSVPTNGVATFINPVGNQSIITRVTGNLFSDINGTINSQGANFFLINPNGIVFGSGAQLNVGKIFAASTANAIDLVDGTGKPITFGTNAAGDAPLLAIDPNVSFNVSRLNFGGGTGEIKNFGTLQTNNQNQYFGLFGGDVTIKGGQVNAPGGRIELGGLTAPGKLEFSPATGIPVSFPAGVTRSNVSLTNQSTVNVAGAGNGDISINARNIDLLGNSEIRGGIEQGVGTVGTVAGDIKLNATGAISIDANSAVLNNVRTNSQGQGGNISIDADTLTIRDPGSAIQAGTYGRGDTGNIRVSIAGNIDLSGSFSGINTLVATNAIGNGGSITVDTGSLSMQTGAVLAATTVGRGNAGNVNVRANTVVLSAADIVSNMEGVGNGGNIAISADTVSLRQGATLAATTFGLGDAGNITVTAKNAVTLANPNTTIFSAVDSGTIGTGGNISIEAGTISFSDGAQLRALSLGQGNAGNTSLSATDNVTLTGQRTAIFNTVEPGGIGRGGNIDVRAGSLSLSNGAFMTASNNGKGDSGDIKVRVSGSVDLGGTNTSDIKGGLATLVGKNTIGNSGNISVDARSISIRDGAALLAGNLGQGNSGTITISATDFAFLSGAGGLFVTTTSNKGIGGDIAIAALQIALDNGSRINAGSVSGNGGNIRIGSNTSATNLLLLRRGAQIATDAAGSTQQGGNGGNININSQFIVAIPIENSDITANAVKGSGGNVDINSQGLFGIQFRPQLTSFSDITVSSDFGQSGNIRINTSGIDPGKDLGELPQVPIDASTQISQTCSTRQIDNKLYITGSGGLPPNTEDPVVGDVVWLDNRDTQSGSIASNARSQPSQKSLQPAVGWTFDRDGKVTLVAANTSRAPNLDRVTCPPSQNFRSK